MRHDGNSAECAWQPGTDAAPEETLVKKAIGRKSSQIAAVEIENRKVDKERKKLAVPALGQSFFHLRAQWHERTIDVGLRANRIPLLRSIRPAFDRLSVPPCYINRTANVA